MLSSKDWSLYVQVSGHADKLLDQYLEASKQQDYALAVHYIHLSNQSRSKAIQLISDGLDD